MKIYRTFSLGETQKLGKEIGSDFKTRPPKSKTRALVVALQGDLGAGKTTFAQGFLRGLGVKRRAVSPTFVIMRRYKIPKLSPQFAIRNSRFSNIFHFDAYRLKQASDLEVLEFEIILSNPKNIILIEWPERIREILPKNTVWIKFAHGKKENERAIKILTR